VLSINIVAPEFPPERGGMQEFALQTALELARRGHRVTVFARESVPGDDELPFDIRRVLHGSYRLDRARLGEIGNADVVHVMNAAWAWVAQLEAPVVLSVHGNDFLAPNPVVGYDLRERFALPRGHQIDYFLAKWRTPRTMRRGLQRCRHIFANSRYTKRRFDELFPECAAKTTVSYLGVRPEFLDRPPARSQRDSNAIPRLLTVCRLSESRKNLDLVLHALARLRRNFGFHYTVVGDGTLRAQLEQLARELGLESSVTFLGQIHTDALLREYDAADLFVLASGMTNTSFEGFGIVYLEANARGVPVLAARIGGAVEAVQEDVSGYFVDRPEIDELESKLHDFLGGGRTFSREACRQFAGGFTWQAVVDHFEGTYRAITREVVVN
jgi:glycosyltransferase involved in cell wall biosynthesis